MDIEQFKKEVSAGIIRDKYYFYKRDEKSKELALQELSSLMNFFRQELKLYSYIFYGTLLGAVREQNFILHDNDIDIAYLSHQHNKNDVLIEHEKIKSILTKKNLLAKALKAGHIHVWGLQQKIKIDVWTSWIGDNKLNVVPVIDNSLTKTHLIPFKAGTIKNYPFIIPNKSEEILNYLYLDWKNPRANNWRKAPWKEIL